MAIDDSSWSEAQRHISQLGRRRSIATQLSGGHNLALNDIVSAWLKNALWVDMLQPEVGALVDAYRVAAFKLAVAFPDVLSEL